MLRRQHYAQHFVTYNRDGQEDEDRYIIIEMDGINAVDLTYEEIIDYLCQDTCNLQIVKYTDFNKNKAAQKRRDQRAKAHAIINERKIHLLENQRKKLHSEYNNKTKKWEKILYYDGIKVQE